MKSNSTKYIGSFLLQFVYKNGFELSSIEQKTDGFRWWHSFVMFCFWQIKVLKFKIKRIFVKLIYFIEGVHFRWILLEDFFFLNAIFFYLHFMFRRMFFLFSTWFFNMVHSNLGNLIKFVFVRLWNIDLSIGIVIMNELIHIDKQRIMQFKYCKIIEKNIKILENKIIWANKNKCFFFRIENEEF